jgi:hypothetical protein
MSVKTGTKRATKEIYKANINYKKGRPTQTFPNRIDQA